MELSYVSGSLKVKTLTNSMTKAEPLFFKMVLPINGSCIYLYDASKCSDCDDSDSNIGFEDGDGDGYPSCGGDCDDNNSSIFPDDLDGDGYSTCDGDCNDDPNDPTAININPKALRTTTMAWMKTDGLSDYDADMDGEDSDQYGGTDCDDLRM